MLCDRFFCLMEPDTLPDGVIWVKQAIKKAEPKGPAFFIAL
jgi:hypothetical protein